MVEKNIKHLHDLHNFEWEYKGKKFKLMKKEFSETKLELFMLNPTNKSRFILVDEVSAGNYQDILERLNIKINLK